IKVESTSQQVIFKGLAPRVVLRNHLQPEGTKTKVNLEEQGRQKVSFSFTQTKKPRQKVFLVPPSPEKAANDISPVLQSTILPSADLTGQSTESKNEQTDPSVMDESQATQSPVPLTSKLKHDKMHFKKQILSVSVVEELPIVSAVLNDTTSENEVLIRSSARIEGETSVAVFQPNSVTDCSEKVNSEESTQEELDTRLKGPTDSSCMGKECKDSNSEPEHSKNVHQPDNILPSYDIDGGSVRTSSSQKSSDSKNVAKCDSQSAAVKKSSTSKSEVSDKSRSDKREEKDEKGSSRYPRDREMTDRQGQIGHITVILKGDPSEVLVNEGGLAPELFLSNEGSRLPMNVETSQKVTEQSGIKPEPTNAVVIKQKSAHVKKSRWDIVGQDTSETQTLQKMVNSEMSSVKKVISVKKIEFNSDAGHEEKCSKKAGSMMDSLKSELDEQTDKATTDSEKEIKHDPGQPFAADGQQTNEVSDQIVSKSPANQAPLKHNCNSDVIHIDQKYANCDTAHNDDSYKPLTQESVLFNCDGKSHSEESETDESDSDSDDGQVSLKRLHSVVVVPKNSTIILETTDHPTPPASPSAFSGQLTYQPDDLNMSINSEIPNSLNTPVKPVECSGEGIKHDVLSVNENKCMPSVQTPYQSQSNLVDSTSQSEATTTLAHTDQTCTVKERLKICVPTDQVPTYTQRVAESGCHQSLDNPDSWHGIKGGREQFGDFSCTDNLRPQNGLNLACDINQTEQPSSTFQQPDSSHATQQPSQLGSAFTRQDSGYWTQANVADKNMPVNRLVPSPCHESMIHPDSLTNDHEEDYVGKAFGLGSGVVIPSRIHPASSAFVQANEISSNCSFVTATAESQIISEPPREGSLRPHRGRGPPKKRRPELESESDNEAEAGLASKRECLEERESCKDLKETKVSSQQEETQRPLLSLKEFLDPAVWKEKAKQKKMPPYFDLIEENVYLTERKKNKSHRDIKRMQCECAVLSREERARGVMACGEDCLNRLLMIECSSRCFNGVYCSNRRFQMKQHADFEVILTESKGWGLRAAKDLQPNTFVLEYCGEVLDHREFKSRVKEYARSKNIHYYFMALKNNEIIDATLKGNCSRFMNHSCEPNCETQKWTVNGQLRVGFFTTKAVKAGTELTFDYQFQRYGKEAQKCYCGAPSCRGFLGGENRVSVRAAVGKKQRERSRKKEAVSALTTVDEELEALLENGEGLSDEKQVVSLCRLMVRVETMEQRLTCVKLIQNTTNASCLKQFLDHHGLSLLWIFMVDLSEAKSNSVNNLKLQMEIMKALVVLPISTKNMLEESRVLQYIQRWAQSHPLGQPTEQDGYSSESTSRAHTPLNTPDGPPVKLAPELDGETPKRAVYRRLKIISENSLDSALSDGSKVSDGKEEEEEEEVEEEPSPEVTADTAEKGENGEELAVTPELLVKQEGSDAVEGSQAKLGLKEEDVEKDKTEVQEIEEKSISKTDENLPALMEENCESEPAESQMQAPVIDQPHDAPSVKAEVDASPSLHPPDESTPSSESSSENERAETLITNIMAPSTISSAPTESLNANMPSDSMETTPSESTVNPEASPLNLDNIPPSSGTSSEEKMTTEVTVESGPSVSGVVTAEVLPLGIVATEGTAVGTPSQDEEEAVSDVESERSQEPQIGAADISEMAARLLDSWKDLKARLCKENRGVQDPKEESDRSLEREAMLNPRTPSSSRERERERDRERERERDWDRDWDREKDSDRSLLRSAERRRRRGSTSPPYPSPYERSSRRNEDRYDSASSSKKSRTKEARTKLSTEERRKLFEQEVAQREAQKQQQQQQQQQQQLQRQLAFNPLVYPSSPSFMTYPPGYPIQTYVDPTNPNAGKVLLPTPPMEPMCVTTAGTVSFDQTTQPLITDLTLAAQSPSTTQASSAASLTHVPATLELASSAQPQQFVQPATPAQDPGVTVLSVPTQTAGAQVQGQQGYATLWDPNTQQTVTVQSAQQYSNPAQPQTAIYYQGQPCQTIYSIPAGYPQTNTPVIQTYTEPATGYLHGQQVYAGHQQGVVVQQGGTVTTIVTSQTVQQEMIVPNNIMDLPPPSPPKPKTIVLPPSWKVARDPEGKIYYYHIVTRQTQWDPPSWDGVGEEATVEHEAEMDLGTPTYDENPSKFSTKTAEADTSSELAKKSKEVFRKEMSQFIVQCLNPYRKPDCKLGRISNTEDFKHLARKLTHGVMNKELKSCKNPEDLECNENVKHKTKEYIKKYMQKFGSVYRPKEDTEGPLLSIFRANEMK
ncbi:hypothetical protein QTP70_013951, partial [Hemibagrus guttatus]